MKVRILSDLHLEFGDLDVPGDKDTVLVLAGDIHVGLRAKFFLEKIAPTFREVLYVLGNHEFYHQDYNTIVKYWTQEVRLPENVHVLHNKTHKIENVNFIGTTLWTNFKNEDYFAIDYARRGMNDFYVIKYRGNRLHPRDTIEFNKEAKAFLKRELKANETNVVITHHLPDAALQHIKFAGSPLNPAFADEDCEDLIAKAKFWLFGHTHDSIDIMLGDCRCICNPRGYDGYELNPGFDIFKEFEV